MKLIVFDTEATALTPGQLCQISYLMIDGQTIEGKNMFLRVEEMSESAYNVHHMSVEQLAELSQGQVFADWAQELMGDFSQADMLIGHNVSADDRYLRVEFERLGMRLAKKKTFCTMNYFTYVLKLKQRVNWSRHPKPPKLQELTEYYGLSEEYIAQKAAEWFGGGQSAHDARYDAAATYLCVVEGTKKGDLKGVLDKECIGI